MHPHYPRPIYPATPAANAMRIGVLVALLFGVMGLLAHSVITGAAARVVATDAGARPNVR